MEHKNVWDTRYISFSASGSHGIAFMGVLACLEQDTDRYTYWRNQLKGVAGTSGGSIAALAVALSLSAEDRNECLLPLGNFENMFSDVDISLLINKYGANDGDEFKSAIEGILVKGGMSATSTLEDIHRLLRLKVVFVAHDLMSASQLYLSHETFPSMKVSDAIFSSCCIPGIFTPFQLSPSKTLCDGCLCEYLPMCFPLEECLFVLIPLNFKPRKGPLDSWQSYLTSIVQASLSPQRKTLQNISDNYCCIEVAGTEELPTIIMNMDNVLMEMLIQCGYAASIPVVYPQIHGVMEDLVSVLLRSSTDVEAVPPYVVNDETC